MKDEKKEVEDVKKRRLLLLNDFVTIILILIRAFNLNSNNLSGDCGCNLDTWNNNRSKPPGTHINIPTSVLW
jgi:hypothetical protein